MRRLGVIFFMVVLVGCAPQQEFGQQFTEELKGNSQVVNASPAAAFGAAQVALVNQGFTITSQSATAISAKRELKDDNNPEISYVTDASVVVIPAGAGRSEVSMSANQQTFLHREDRIWWHLFWLIPLFPIGTEYQTVLRSQDTISDPAFYDKFFTALNKELRSIGEEQPAAPPQSRAASIGGAPGSSTAVQLPPASVETGASDSQPSAPPDEKETDEKQMIVTSFTPTRITMDLEFKKAAALFPSFCDHWQQNLRDREANNLSKLSFTDNGGSMSATYTGYGKIEACSAHQSKDGYAIGRITYKEFLYRLAGESEAAARHAAPRPIDTTNTTEIFRWDKDLWFY